MGRIKKGYRLTPRRKETLIRATLRRKEIIAESRAIKAKESAPAQILASSSRPKSDLFETDPYRKSHLNQSHECAADDGSRKQASPVQVQNEFIRAQPCNYHTDVDGTSSKHLNLASGSFFCLLCSNVTSRTLNSFNDKADFVAMFILKKMLNVPSKILVQLLSTSSGNPCDWITVCHQCSPIVTEALAVQKKISQLELQLRKCQKKMKETIAKTYEQNQSEFNKQSVDGLSSCTARSSLLHLIGVTKDTRHYVSNGVWAISNLTFYINDDDKQSDNLIPFSSPSQEEDNAKENAAGVDANMSPTAADSYSDDDGGDAEQDDHSPINEHLTNDKEMLKLPSSSVVVPKHIIASEFKKYKLGADPVYRCAMCPQLKPMLLHSFVKHLVFHYEHPYKCGECNAYFTGSELELEKRSEYRRNSKEHPCTMDTLVKIKLETEKIWECGHCSSTFKLYTERESHEKQVHPEEKPSPLPYSCSRCPDKFRDYHEWRIHRALQHPDLGKLGCFYCDAIFKLETIEDADIENVQGRHDHIREEHGPSHSRHGRHLWDCRTCGMNFETLNKLTEHIEKEHKSLENYLLSCPICFKTYSGKGRQSLEKHIRKFHQVNGRQEALICDMCPYQVTAHCKIRLLEHKFFKHEAEPDNRRRIKNCSRDDCSFKCLMKSTMDTHMMNVHDAERKHKCSVCGKAFMDSSKLGRHMEIHKNSTNKPFQCEICGNSFAVKNYLYIHMRLSHQNRPFASTHKKKLSRKRKAACDQNTPETTPTPPSSLSSSSLELEQTVSDHSFPSRGMSV